MMVMMINHSLEFYYTSLFSTVLIYILFFSNLVSLLPKITICCKYRKVSLRLTKLRVRDFLINKIFNRKIYQMSLMCTMIELFFHLLAFLTSLKYFIKSKESYLVEMEANQLHSQRLVDSVPYRLNSQVPTINIRIENPANVDLFLFRYCLLFFLKVFVWYFRFRRIFLETRDSENPFDLEVFRFTSSSEGVQKGAQNPRQIRSVKRHLEHLSQEPSCSICSVKYEEGDRVVNFECQNHHFFHLACINEWIHRSPTCPLCRAGLFR